MIVQGLGLVWVWRIFGLKGEVEDRRMDTIT
jgi:hypothetical protein